MSISFEQLRTALKSSNIPVFRDEAPSKQKYPYIIYEFVSEQHKRASSKVIAEMPLYQIAYITKGIELELAALKDVLNAQQIEYASFTAAPYDENDDKVTQFITYVRCVQ